MRYPKYIKDSDDGMILKLTDDGVFYKDSYLKSNEKEYNKYNKEIEESWDREARLTNKEWKVVIKLLSKNKNGRLISDKLKEYLGYGDDM